MRNTVLLLLFFVQVSANEVIDFYNEDSKNEIICQVGKHAYKVLSKENSTLVKIHGHNYIKPNKENLYLFIQGCSPLNNKKQPIIY